MSTGYSNTKKKHFPHYLSATYVEVKVCVQMVSVSSSWSQIHHLSALVMYRRHTYWRLARACSCRHIRLQTNRSLIHATRDAVLVSFQNTRTVPDNI